MQKRFWRDEHLKSYKNHFCDSEKSTIFEFLPLAAAVKLCAQEELPFSNAQLLEINRYAVLKNLLADCKELTLRSVAPELAQRAMKEFGMNGNVLFDARELAVNPHNQPPNRSFYIDDILSCSEPELAFIAERIGKLQGQIYINFYRSLEEAGSLDNLFHKSPAHVLEDFGLLDRKAHIIGCNFLDKDDGAVLASYQAQLILTPQADMLLGRGAINLQALLSQGLEIGLGSGEFPFLDMLEEGRLALGNTANLMFDPFAVSKKEIENMIVSDLDVDEMITDVRFEKQRQTVEKIFKELKI